MDRFRLGGIYTMYYMTNLEPKHLLCNAVNCGHLAVWGHLEEGNIVAVVVDP